MKNEKWGLVALLMLLFAACDDKEKAPRLAESKGLPCEMVVVADPAVLQSSVADTIKTIVQGEVPGLGTGEDCFRPMTISTQGYGSVYKVMHSQLMVLLDPAQKTPQLGVARDVTARPQIQVVVKAGNLDDLGRFLGQKRQRIQQLITDFQLDRMSAIQQRKYSKRVSDDLRQLAGYSICMPTEMIATKRGKNFLWGGTNRNEKDQNFVFYTLPWTGQDITDVDGLIQLRDSVMQANIPGRTPDQWMTTTRVDGVPVVTGQLRQVAGREQMEVRGLWEMHAGYMGGPFVSLAHIDTAARRIVVTEGFVYSPSTSKRDLIRALEASLRTLRKVSRKSI